MLFANKIGNRMKEQCQDVDASRRKLLPLHQFLPPNQRDAFLYDRFYSDSVDETVHTLKKRFSITFCTDGCKSTEPNFTEYIIVENSSNN